LAIGHLPFVIWIQVGVVQKPRLIGIAGCGLRVTGYELRILFTDHW
jgi:hypothetical protein